MLLRVHKPLHRCHRLFLEEQKENSMKKFITTLFLTAAIVVSCGPKESEQQAPTTPAPAPPAPPPPQSVVSKPSLILPLFNQFKGVYTGKMDTDLWIPWGDDANIKILINHSNDSKKQVLFKVVKEDSPTEYFCTSYEEVQAPSQTIIAVTSGGGAYIYKTEINVNKAIPKFKNKTSVGQIGDIHEIIRFTFIYSLRKPIPDEASEEVPVVANVPPEDFFQGGEAHQQITMSATGDFPNIIKDIQKVEDEAVPSFSSLYQSCFNQESNQEQE